MIERRIVDGKPTYFFGDISLKGALDVMDRSNGSVRFYVKTKVNRHEFHAVSEGRHNIYLLTVGNAEKMEIILRLIDRYRSQRKMAANDREAELRYRHSIAVRADRKRRGGIA